MTDTAIADILAAAQLAAFEWNLASDAMVWSDNAASVLRVDDRSGIDTGTSYQLRIGTEHSGLRYQRIWDSGQSDTGDGVIYNLHYRFLPNGRRRPNQMWIEERGRWYAGSDGRPRMVKAVLRVIDRELEEIERLRRLSETDELTGLMNHRMLLSGLDSAITESRTTGKPAAFMLATINNLAIINQTFGFEVGDEVIATVSERLSRQMRAGDIIGRYSANKIGMVVNDCEVGGLQAVARRLMTAVRGSIVRCSTSDVATTISLGAVQIPQHADTNLTAVAAALEALDIAREVRADRFICYSPTVVASRGRRRTIETAENVISAFEEQRMRVALQAIVHAKSGSIGFYECLLRILLRNGEMATAGQFVPIAEQLGLAGMIDQRVLELAVGLVKADPSLQISFNVSGLTSTDPEWLMQLRKLTAGNRALSERLTVEITETVALADIDETAAFVDILKEIGCKVALDDFGAGYTSFRNLRALAVDMVKLDGSFVQNLKDDKTNLIFVRSMVDLARNFGMTTVAERVTDAETAGILADAGVDYLQGYHFGEPQIAPLPLPVLPKR